MWTTARSEDGSAPRTVPAIVRPSVPNLTLTFLAFSTTWSLVTSVPALSTRNPVPVPDWVRMETTAGLAAA
jgi:hypothetical protein